MGKYFGTDGFRGEAGITLTADHAYKVGRFLGWYYNALRKRNGDTDPARIVIGKDTRRSSYMFEYSLVAGLTASGADAYLLHVTTTPSVAYIARVDDFDCGIMISASHNPYYDNGIKLIDCYGEKMPEETLLLVEDYIDGIRSRRLGCRLNDRSRLAAIHPAAMQEDTTPTAISSFPVLARTRGEYMLSKETAPVNSRIPYISSSKKIPFSPFKKANPSAISRFRALKSPFFSPFSPSGMRISSRSVRKAKRKVPRSTQIIRPRPPRDSRAAANIGVRIPTAAPATDWIPPYPRIVLFLHQKRHRHLGGRGLKGVHKASQHIAQAQDP